MTDSVFDIILKHQKAFSERLNLVASENSPSFNSRLAFLSDVMNRYYFPLEFNSSWAFPGNEHIEAIYTRCKELLTESSGARFINLKPISGVNAMTIALSALIEPGGTIATIAPENGGHEITSVLAQRLGARTVFLPYIQEQFTIDVDALKNFIYREKVRSIYLDQANILFPYPLVNMKKTIPESVNIYYDASHVMGLIFGDNFQNPLQEGALFLAGSTHKTIPGPHKAFIATNNEEEFKRIEMHSSFLVSHDHGADVAALAIVLEEMRGKWQKYASQVVTNARYFAKRLEEKNFSVVGRDLGFTRTHQIFIDIAQHMKAFEAVKTLARNNIITNSIRAPSIKDRIAIRIGVQEITHIGATENTMGEIAEIFEDIFIKKTPEKEIKDRVRTIKRKLTTDFSSDFIEKVSKLLRP